MMKNEFWVLFIFILSFSREIVCFRENVLSLILKGAKERNGTTCLGLLHEIEEGVKEHPIWVYKCKCVN